MKKVAVEAHIYLSEAADQLRIINVRLVSIADIFVTYVWFIPS